MSENLLTTLSVLRQRSQLGWLKAKPSHGLAAKSSHGYEAEPAHGLEAKSAFRRKRLWLKVCLHTYFVSQLGWLKTKPTHRFKSKPSHGISAKPSHKSRQSQHRG